MSNLGRFVGLLFALAMFALSVFTYLKTGDWVAAVFALGSLGYFVFFLTIYHKNSR